MNADSIEEVNHEWTRIHTNDRTVKLGVLFMSLRVPFGVKIDRRKNSIGAAQA
jgi:hypothetical protein